MSARLETGAPVRPTRRRCGRRWASARVVRLVEAAAQHRDQVGHLVDGQPERPGADVLAPQRQHDQAGLVVPGDPERAVATAGVEEDRPRSRERAGGWHVQCAPRNRTDGSGTPSLPDWSRQAGLPKYTVRVPELPEVEALALDLRGPARRPRDRQGRHRRVQRAEDLRPAAVRRSRAPSSRTSPGTASSSTSRPPACTWSCTWPAPAGSAGATRCPRIPPRPATSRRWRPGSSSTTSAGLDITEAGTKKSLAMYVVRSPADVPGIARLGPDPLADEFTIEVLRGILDDAGRAQIKGVLRHQGTIAGIGNAYSDELLHAARMSPFKPADSLTEDRARRRCTTRSAGYSATPSSGRAASPRASSRARRRPTSPSTARPARSARCAATWCARSRSPTRASSTAPPARPAASRWPTDGCRSC